MLPCVVSANDETMPSVESIPSVPLDESVKVPAPVTFLPPQLSIPPLFTVSDRDVGMGKSLFNVSVFALATAKFMVASVNVPADCEKLAETVPPVKLTVPTPAPVEVNVPPD